MGDSEDSKTEKPVDESNSGKIKIEKEKPVIVKVEESKEADKGDCEAVTKRCNQNNEVNISEGIKENPEENKTETILSSQSLKSSNPSISIPNDQAVPSISASLKNVKEKHLNRNQSDILPSLRELPRDEDPSMMIFSSKGLPTKKYFRRREVNSTILPFGFNDKKGEGLPPSPRTKVEAELTPKISQTVPKKAKQDEEGKKKAFGDRDPNVPNPSVSRNVLTGFGVSSKDEFKTKSARRKDGNPVLGEGYDEPVVPNNVGRVPPGGFSSGLW